MNHTSCVLLAIADHSIGRVLAQLLRASSCNVLTVATFAEYQALAAETEFRVLAIDSLFLDKLEKGDLESLFANARAKHSKVLVLNEGSLNDSIPWLIRHQGVTNLVAHNSQIDMMEALITANKLINGVNGDIFGIAKYLPWGTRVIERTIHSSDRKAEILSEMDDFASQTGCDHRLRNAFVTVADEFIANAMYNAPVDATGAPRFRCLDRTFKVDLHPGEEVTVKYACIGHRLFLSVTDRFGSLSADILTSYLERWFQEKEHNVSAASGGAGLGLFFVFKFLSTIIVNMAPGQCTEFIGAIDISGTYRDFIARNKSFHMFTAGPRTVW